jgi:beta-N-acetylhexosaminidase
VSELERLAASVLCVGFDGAFAEHAPLRELAELGPGGVVLFARNAGDLVETRALVDAVCAAIEGEAGARPFVAVDQEGGRVARLRRGAHDVPPMMALGAADDPALAERVGLLVAGDLRSAGVTVDFAPVLDLALEARSAVVGTRAFGDDPQRVGALGAAFGRGLERGGVAATYKHFPGHGATAHDSHDLLPRLTAGADLLRSRDLVPFRIAVAAGARAIMVAHVVAAAFDDELPASLSPRVVAGVLRGELGFTGACFTDCLEMDALAGFGAGRAAVLALQAGADCALISHSLERAGEARDAIVAAVLAGDLPESRLREASARLAALRASHAAEPAPDDGAAAEAARRAITVVRSPSPRDYTLEAGEAVTVISFDAAAASGADDRASEEATLNLSLRRRRVRSESLRVPAEPTPEMIEHLLAVVTAQRSRRVVLQAAGAVRFPEQRAALDALLGDVPDAIVALMREPFDAVVLPAARIVLCAYGANEVCVEALADVLTARASAHGRLPVALAS